MGKGTLGRVYGGDPTLIHVQDGKRSSFGAWVADHLDGIMRYYALNRTLKEKRTQKLCPGCYMVVMFNALVWLAKDNGQDVKELARSMQLAFKKLEEQGDYLTSEEIDVILDPEDAVCPLKENN